ncbi:hypothetical protein L6164_026871 [Bauhinia variegata]|uniref:Uncharacterized protein n=1 Tax=Bauhinia variegata TaxID=167791 RepID=A0ACB9LRN4_BAUVA|nr:hypothetical protein L6164_026871 [Bauhinia variegata]
MTSAARNVVASAVGGKKTRACDSCIKKRARWYCAADDAFLCQTCDSSVHLANPLARRHERVFLKKVSDEWSDGGAAWEVANYAPLWHRGFTKKARTPRHVKRYSIYHQTSKVQNELARRNPFCMVPEVGSDEANSHDENEAQLLYRVPIFDPSLVAELCTPLSSVTSAEAATAMASPNEAENKANKSIGSKDFSGNNSEGVETFHEFLPSDKELAEFAADVESLLGRGLEDDYIGMEELDLIYSKQEECCVGTGKVKIEEEEEDVEMAAAASASASAACKVEMDQMEREPFELNFDFDSAEVLEEMEEKLGLEINRDFKNGYGGELDGNDKVKKKILLRLDYEAVITAWASHKCPWTNGNKPEFGPNECWLDCMGACGIELHHAYGEWGGLGIQPTIADVGREARVSRYREKRRTRLFSKKIRYEVRKLNAENRPRMKGRFVKRASFAAVSPSFPLLTK